MKLLRLKVITLPNGVKSWRDSEDRTIFNVFPSGEKIDMREKPPFNPIVPCPWCGTENNSIHDPMKHTDPKLGIPNDEVLAFSQAKGISTVEAANRILKARQG